MESTGTQPALPASIVSLLEDGAEAFCALDRQGRYVYLNRRAEQLLGRRRSEVLGRTVRDASPGPVGEALDRGLRRAAEGGVTTELRVEWPAPGTWHDVSARPSPDGVAFSLTDVTAHVTAGNALRGSWDHIRLITDNLPALIGYVDRGLRYRFGNQAYLDWFGVHPQQVIGAPVEEMLGPDVFRQRLPYMERALAGERVRFEGPTHHQRLGPRHTEVSYVPDAAGGEVRGFYVLVHDLTDRTRSEQQLRRGHDLLDRAFDHAAVGLAVSDRSGVIVRVNRTLADTLGYEPQELVGRPLNFCMAPEDAEAARRRIAEREAGLTPPLRDWNILRRDGAPRTLRATATPMHTPDGGEPLYISVAYDVTEQREAERAVLEAGRRMSFILGTITDGHIVLDGEFRFVEINPAARRMVFGDRPLSELVGNVFWECYPQARDTEFYRRYHDAAATGTPAHFEAKSAISGRWLETHAYPREGRLEIYFRDITERKEAELALERARQEAEAARAAAEAANRAKDHFLAVLSHELRTPLTPVVMTLAGLEMDRSLSHDVREDLAMIRRNVELETRLIDDLLDVTRIVNGKLRLHPQPTDAHALLESVLGLFQSEVRGKRLRLKVELGAADARVSGDAARLQQVFWNLVKNAIKFTPEGGGVAVRTSNPAARALRVEVVDDGVGIEPAALPRLFNAFEQAEQSTTRQFGGLGLGLAISRALVELHGGTIRAESEGRDRGATFVVDLPTVGAVERLLHPFQPPHPALPAGRAHLRVLLVEDHPDTLRTLKRLLERMGYAVVPAASAAAALHALDAEPVDVVVSDIGLPDATGHDLMRRVRESYRVPGIAVSGFGMDADVRNSRDAGFLAHLTKPVDLHQLDAAIRSAVGQAAAR